MAPFDLDAMRRACPEPPVSRFAPAPTGFLHLGHLANAIYVWGVTRALGGRVLLRIEDHDRDRSRPEFERAILDDLEWLGFEPDEPPIAAFRSGACAGRQSDRDAVYARALDALRDGRLIYACACTRAAIAAAGGAQGGEIRYPGTCADKGLPETGAGIRVRLPGDEVRFEDLALGPQTQRPAEQCGDLLVRDRHGCWTYQFVAAVDDFATGVNLVIRGADLLASTGRQMALARLLGRPHPARFLHHPLIMKSATQKLSKSDRDTGICDLRDAGWSAPRLIGEAAARIGLLAEPRPIDARQVSSLIFG